MSFGELARRYNIKNSKGIVDYKINAEINIRRNIFSGQMNKKD